MTIVFHVVTQQSLRFVFCFVCSCLVLISRFGLDLVWSVFEVADIF